MGEREGERESTEMWIKWSHLGFQVNLPSCTLFSPLPPNKFVSPNNFFRSLVSCLLSSFQLGFLSLSRLLPSLLFSTRISFALSSLAFSPLFNSDFFRSLVSCLLFSFQLGFLSLSRLLPSLLFSTRK